MLNSYISWIDHDQEARQRTYEILSSFRTPDSRDELGIGSLRDSVSDILFPGVSTIQTRLRYMLFIPWIHIYLESRRTTQNLFKERADYFERRLIPLLVNCQDNDGAFGKTGGEKIDRLPSRVYWGGLGAWGIRRMPISQEQYYNMINSIYSDHAQHRRIHKRASDESNQYDLSNRAYFETWDLALPLAPKGFPRVIENLDFSLRKHEAEYLLAKMSIDASRISRNQRGQTLLSHVANQRIDLKTNAPWDLPRDGLPPTLNTLLNHSRRFSHVMQTSALLYNLMVAEVCLAEVDSSSNQAKYSNLIEEYRGKFKQWVETHIDINELKLWDLKDFYHQSEHPNHTVTKKTKEFIGSWLELMIEKHLDILDSDQARSLIKNREHSNKGSKARLQLSNRAARDLWSTRSGLNPLTYRWSNVIVFLKDLYAGLDSDE